MSLFCDQVFKASRPGVPLRVYFIIYSGSVEEQVRWSSAHLYFLCISVSILFVSLSDYPPVCPSELVCLSILCLALPDCLVDTTAIVAAVAAVFTSSYQILDILINWLCVCCQLKGFFSNSKLRTSLLYY